MSRGYPNELTKEAKEDGIYMVDGYLAIPCEVCGGTLFRSEYSRKRQYICDRCKKKIKAMTHADVVALTAPQKTIDTHEERFLKAIQNIEDQVKDFDKYKSAIKTASTRITKYGSVPEAMAAIELLKNKQKIIPQQRVHRYTVDFCLPDLKVALEIDGQFYHRDLDKEIHRDACLRRDLGFDWTVIHVSAEKIVQDVTVVMQPLQTRIDSLSSPQETPVCSV